LEPKRVYELAKEFLRAKGYVRSHPKGGRPQTYDEAFILTLAIMQNLRDFSFRETLEFGKEVFGRVPGLFTFWYRIKTMPTEFISEFTAFVGRKLIKKNGKDSF